MRTLISTLALFSALLGPQARADTSADTASGFEGHWRSTCMVADAFGQMKTEDYVTQSNAGLQTTTYYSDAECLKPIIRQDWTYSQTLGSELRSGVRAVDLSYTALSVTALSDVGRVVLEAWGYCGSTSWAVNEKRDITSASGAVHCSVKVPYTDYTLVSVDGDKLYIGKFSDSAAGRPTDLDRSVPFLTKVAD